MSSSESTQTFSAAYEQMLREHEENARFSTEKIDFLLQVLEYSSEKPKVRHFHFFRSSLLTLYLIVNFDHGRALLYHAQLCIACRPR